MGIQLAKDALGDILDDEMSENPELELKKRIDEKRKVGGREKKAGKAHFLCH